MKHHAWFAALLPLLSVGCSEFARLELEPKSSPPASVTVTYEKIQLVEGIAVGIKAIPVDTDDDEMDEETVVELTSTAPTILGLSPGAEDQYYTDEEDREPAANWNFVLFGVSPGNTSVTVTVDGAREGEIPVEVLPQL
ncbi:hypothetical protein [Polyangium aurulentum]|uniref:hypothetical protein n=1 Tax=Polyangium aurulentum TaxID=2567896 RepID=UPI0010AED244|nr:hypothetical protein [Polyangium aurulentum]UQA60223.1 hypothetical protein E8A73_007015 [Polyangium aurulentum]